MLKEISFTERQRFRQWWLWLLLLSVNGMVLAGAFSQSGGMSKSFTGQVIAIGLTIALTLFFALLRLDTKIDTQGISVRFFPFHIRFKYFSWEKINRAYVRQYKPLLEYGGWGLRMGLPGKGKAYNVSGNIGLQLEFTDHKRLLIGTQKPEELSETLRKLGQL